MNQIKITESEKTLMEILWEKEKIFMKDILENYSDPKPASTTIATLLSRLQKKGLVGYKTYGNSREYHTKIEKETYFNQEMNNLIDRFFNSSVSQFASFFTDKQKLTKDQLKELRNLIDKKIKE